MTVSVVFADSTDGYVASVSDSYATARNAVTGTAVSVASSLVSGQTLLGGTYTLREAFARYAFTTPAGEVVTGAAFRMFHGAVSGSSVPRSLEIREYAYASPLTTAAWRSATAFSGLPLLATVEAVNLSNGKFVYAGSAALMTKLAAGSSTISTVMSSSRFRTGVAPTIQEECTAAASEDPGTTNDPALMFTSVARSTLFGVMAGSAQLSDGSWAVLESDGGTTPVITLRRHTGATVTTVATLPAAFAAPLGAQAISLVADATDNLYAVGTSSASGTSIVALKFTKGAGWIWTAGTPVTSPLPAYSAPINQVVAAWQGAWTIFVVVGHAPGTGISGTTGDTDVSYAVLDPSTLAVQAMGSAPGALLPQVTHGSFFDSFTNETGSGLDVVASSPGATSGYVATLSKDTTPGGSGPLGIGRYVVTGSSLTDAEYSTTDRQWSLKDASAKVRVVPTGTTTVAVVSADPDAGWGLSVAPYQATPSGWTMLGQNIRLAEQGIASMPASSALTGSLAWDAVYAAFQNKLWIYYPDATDPRIIRRTGVDLTTYQATKEAITVATVGAAGGTNLAVRVARNAGVNGSALVTVAHKASGGALSTVYVVDAFNVSPTEPTLTTRANYDATQAATFAWTFNDPNLPGDGQTAYQLQIVRVSDGVTVVDTGKVASTTPNRSVAGGTLANDVTYQWRVMTWDQGDFASPWSVYGMFSTGSGGSVSITDPAVDNPPGIITDDYLVQWSLAGTTQTKYRAWVTRNGTGATVYDSGWVTGSIQNHRVTSMVSDVAHTINVQVENALAVRSSVGSRGVTPSYSTPDVPTMDLQAMPQDGYVLVAPHNPLPSGDRPTPTLNRIYRRLAGSGDDYEVIAEVVPGQSYRDYTVPSGTAYEYQVEAVAP